MKPFPLARRGHSLIVAFFLSAVSGCEKPSTEPVENATPSPNASILPAPLSSGAQPSAESPSSTSPSLTLSPAASAGKTGDGGTPVQPQPLRSDQALATDPFTQRELSGISLEGEW